MTAKDAPELRLRLGARLSAIAAWIPAGAVFADVGTDHARLPTAVVLRDPQARAIGVDVRAGPLSAAAATVARFGVASRVELRLADGLSAIEPGEVDTVTISGMGGERMVEILSAARASAVLRTLDRLILQPNTAAARLRRWLVAAGWALVDERLVCARGHVYVTILAQRGAQPSSLSSPARWSEDEWLLGPHALRRGGPALITLLRQELARCRRAETGLARATETEEVLRQRQQLARRRARLEEKLEEKLETRAGATQGRSSRPGEEP